MGALYTLVSFEYENVPRKILTKRNTTFHERRLFSPRSLHRDGFAAMAQRHYSNTNNTDRVTRADRYTWGPVHAATGTHDDRYTRRPLHVATVTLADSYTWRPLHLPTFTLVDRFICQPLHVATVTCGDRFTRRQRNCLYVVPQRQ